MHGLYAALSYNEEHAGRFLGTMVGTVPIPEFLSQEYIGRVARYH
jgi:hypothetical protein